VAASAAVGVGPDRDASGPAVAMLFHRLLAAIFLVAWASLGAQVEVLIGSRGLLPAAPYLVAARQHGLGFATLPTVFWIDASDTALRAGIWVGAALAVMALLGIWPRRCLALMTGLYLSYVTIGRTFLSFQWDNLLLECGTLAVFLPTDRPARWIHVLFRLLLFKLYWESGIAKWESYLGDWQSGEAMRFYYETAPLPAWPAWYAHHLPLWWHHLESWAVLVVELVVPCFAFGPRALKLCCAALLTGFQIGNALTANYGFFVYLALALHVFLLADRDVAFVIRRLPGTGRRRAARTRPRLLGALRRLGAAAVIGAFALISTVDALDAFTAMPAGWRRAVAPLARISAPLRLINTYHLFGHITEERIEPEVQVESHGVWQPLDFHHKPGALDRAPDFVAPHQPRVDFQLWFYGLSFEHGTPEYVIALLDRICRDPDAVQPLFRTAIPTERDAVRIVFWRYRFTPPGANDRWWTRDPVATSSSWPCTHPPGA
jgi:hypothetical protein